MKVSLSLERSYSDDVAIMVDALRASTTITAAIENFKEIIPVKSIEDAEKLSKDLRATLAGERGGAAIKGFDTGNSPLDIQKFKGKVLVLTTSNGTRILEDIKAKTLIGSFVNAKAVALKALELADHHIEVVMAGVGGEFVIEDFLGAGEIIGHLKDEKLDEMALAALMASSDKMRVDDAVENSRSASGLRALGLGEDVEFSLKRDIYNKVPLYKDGIIKRL